MLHKIAEAYPVALSDNEMLFQIRATTDLGAPYTPANMPPNYRVEFRIQFEAEYESGDFETIVTMHSIPDGAGHVYFDISEIIAARIWNTYLEPPIPPFGTGTAFIANNIRRYIAGYREIYDDQDPPDPAFTDYTTKSALIGGVDTEIHGDTNYLANMTSADSLLTWYPSGKILSLSQPDYLAWYNYTTFQQTVDLEVEVYDETNTAPVQTLNLFTLDVPADNTAIFPVGYTQLGLSTLGVDVKKYRVRVERAGAVWSPWKTYYVDARVREVETWLLYQNGFGMPEVLRCTGVKKTDLEVKRLQSDRIQTTQFAIPSPHIYQYGFEFNRVYTYRSGFLRADEVEALHEMLVYNRVFELGTDRYFPVYLTDTKFKIGEETQYLRALEFKAIRAIKKKLYSDAIVQDVDVVCGPGFWQEDAPGDCWKTIVSGHWQNPN